MKTLLSRAAITILAAGMLFVLDQTTTLAQDPPKTAVDLQMANPGITRDGAGNVIFHVTLCNNGANDAPAGYLGLIRIIDWPNGGGYQGRANVAVPAIAAGQCVTVQVNFGRHPRPARTMVQLKLVYYEPGKLGKGFYSAGLQIPPTPR